MIVNKKSIYVASVITDFILINLSFLLALQISHTSELNFEQKQPYLLLVILNFVWFFYTNSSEFYEEFLIRPFPIQIYNIFKLSIVISIFNVLFLFVIKQELYTRNFIVINGLIVFIAITIRSIIFKSALRTLRSKGKSIRNLLIIGANKIGQRFKDVITKNPEYGHRFVGFINDAAGADVLGDFSELDKIIKEKNVEDVVIALHTGSGIDLDEMVSICNKNAVKIHVIPDFFKFLSGRFQISSVSNLPVITIRDEPLNEFIQRFIKRFFDMIFSFLVTCFVLSWFLPIMSLLIRLDSSGPALFIQERFGMKRKPFKCMKFRTLTYQKKSSVEFEPIVKKDPRVTRIGKMLRKTNLDELPQFINVLKGDMSVVGPRPLTKGVDEVYQKIYKDVKMRYNVRPGLTGWSQINGLRGEVAGEEENKQHILEKMKFDLWYIENWSLKFDIQIILITIWHMIRGDTKG
ncbi:MAG: exopolysaccharide biosynthesis polyprenyl glycosylphosphotransferase, partial [Ignavibacteriaceae bacterium]|nr:exopolysaccharide biosynthesis polyprenyl glycosylphosphotransferase [Ignavibacteriaceae bacterium]